jgi:hypothetical protein
MIWVINQRTGLTKRVWGRVFDFPVANLAQHPYTLKEKAQEFRERQRRR